MVNYYNCFGKFIAIDKKGCQENYFSYFSMKTYFVGTH